MPVFFRWYRNSFLASLVSIMGSAMLVLAATLIVALVKGEESGEGSIAGAIGLIALGLLFLWLGGRISANKARKKAEKIAAQENASRLSSAAASEPRPTAAANQPQRNAAAASEPRPAAAMNQPQWNATAASEPRPTAAANQPQQNATAASASRMDFGGTAPSADDRKTAEGMSLEEVFELAQRYEDAGDYRQVLNILRGAESRFPDQPGIYNQMGIACRNLNEFAQASAYYKKAIELNPNNPIYLSNNAVALMAAGNAQEALGSFEKVLPLLKRDNNPNYSTVLANYAIALGKCGYSENAVRCLREAEQLGYKKASEARLRLEEMGIYYH